MLSSKKRLIAAAPLVVVALAAAACGSNSTKAGSNTLPTGKPTATLAQGKPGGDFRLGLDEPTAIDPYNSQESEGELVTKALFTGLVNLDSNNEITATDSASTKLPDVNADCSQWTFHLAAGKFTNGEAVDANSFIRGWTRASAKAAASDVAEFMSGIAGYDDLNTGTATTFSGLTAPDAQTLVVKLSTPDCQFSDKTLLPVFSPVPMVAGDASNKTYNDEPIGNGKFKMSQPWQHDTSISLVRNDDYSYGAKANLDKVDITIITDVQAEYDGLAAGTFDYARIPTASLPAAKAKYDPMGDFIAESKYGINYLLPMIGTAPLQSAGARMAISYAIDRDAIISGVFSGFQTKATSIIPPALSDYYSANVCASCVKQDTAMAKSLAMANGLTPGTAINLEFNTGGGHEAWTAAVKSQLETVLGLKVTYTGVPFKTLLSDETKPTASGLFRAAWGADYPTADDFLSPLLSTGSINLDANGLVQGDNRGRYSNPAFDTLLKSAQAATSDATRAPIIKQAEALAIGTDQALIPLWYRSQYRVYDSTKFANVDMDFFEDPTIGVITIK